MPEMQLLWAKLETLCPIGLSPIYVRLMGYGVMGPKRQASGKLSCDLFGGPVAPTGPSPRALVELVQLLWTPTLHDKTHCRRATLFS